MNCKDKGYEVGQVFEVIRDDTFTEGSIIVLSDNEGPIPFFDLIKGKTYNGSLYRKGVKTITGGFETLNNFKRIYPPEEESKTVKVLCEGKETEISRESAKALNLI